jgi:hypothetical protein
MLFKTEIKIADVEELEYRVIEVNSQQDLPQVVQNIRDEFNNQVIYVKFGITSLQQ